MDENQMATSTTSSTTTTSAVEMIVNQLNELKNKFENKKSSVTNDIQIPSCIIRRIGLLYGAANHLTTKKQTKILKKWLDELIVKIQLLANNEVDTDESDDK
jgi:tetrahydromethanopterin S-methyltransferase subunit G